MFDFEIIYLLKLFCRQNVKFYIQYSNGGIGGQGISPWS